MLLLTLLKRTLATVPTLLALTLLVFMLVKAVPGDPAQLLLGEHANKDSLAAMRAQMGLDKPLSTQYFLFMQGLLVHGDLGRTAGGSEEVRAVLQDKVPATCELAAFALLFAVVCGVPAGLLAAVFAGGAVDSASMAVAMIGVSMPVFWLALILTWVFGLELGWLPISGRLAVTSYYEPVTGFVLIDALLKGDGAMFVDSLKHLLLPAVTLGTIPMAYLARTTRAAMLEVIRQDYVRTAKAKGLAPLWLYGKHALKNALLPLLTMLGLQLGLLLGGAMITETIYSWPGLGSWLLSAVASRDTAAIEGGVLAVAVMVVAVNLAVDLLYTLIDPRLRAS